jgi:rod shape-determining protein MreB and related proteins
MRLRPGIAVDLGTVNTLIHVDGRGLVLEEPSVVALERATGKVAAVGSASEALAGKEPEGIEVVWPLRDGVIADFEASALMFGAFWRRVHLRRGPLRPLAVICVPRGATFVERRAVSSIVQEQRPRCVVRLVDEPLAASIGAGSDPASGDGSFVVDVGGGTTEVAVVAAGRVVRARSLRVGGNAMDEAIHHAVKAEFGLSLGRRTSERLKIALGLVGGGTGWAEVVGVDAAREQLRTVCIPGDLVAAALETSVGTIIAAVHQVLSETPPDIAEDVFNGRIQMTGGGSLLLGLPARIEASTGIQASVVDDPLRCLVRGGAEILKRSKA